MAAAQPDPDDVNTHESTQLNELQKEWKEAQERCRADLQGTDYQKALHFETVDALYEDISNSMAAQDPVTQRWIEQLRPYLEIMQNVFLLLAVPAPPLNLDTKLFFGLLYLIITGVIRSADTFNKFESVFKKLSWQLRLLNRYARRLGGDFDVRKLIVSALTELINLWVHARSLFTSQKSPLVQWSRVEPMFEAAETQLNAYVNAVAEIVKVEAAFGKDSRTSSSPFKMLLLGQEDDDLFPIHTLERDVSPLFSRNEEVDGIESFMRPSPVQGAPLRKCVLLGLGGSGKTMTALAYAHRSREAHTYDAIFWISSQSLSHIDRSFMKCVIRLNLSTDDMTKDPDGLKLRIRTWLEKTKKRWLIILDNVDDASLAQHILPSANGCVLITTRYKSIARELQAQQLYELSPLNEKQSLEMFQGLCNLWRTAPNSLSKEDDLPETKAFLRELGGLPLAIEQMAAYAAFREKTISQLHNEFTRSFKRIAGGISTKRVTGSDSVIDAPAMTLATVWDLQFAEVRSTLAGYVLGLLSLLSPDSIPRDLFEPDGDWDYETCEIIMRGVGEEVQTDPADSAEDAVTDALDHLNQLALIKSTDGNLSVHRLVQKAFMHPRIVPEGSTRTPGRHHLELLKTELLQSLFNTICELLNFRFPKADAGDQSHWGKWESCARYMAHVESVKAHFEAISIRVKSENGTLNVPEVFLDLIQNSAWYQYEIGNYQECLDLSLFGQRHSPPNSDKYGHFGNHAACAYFEMHQVMKGQEQIDIALAIREKTRGPTDPQRGNAYHNKAILEYSSGRYDQAKAYNAKAHKIRQATKGNYLPVAHYHEGIINMLQGNLDAADVELGICADYVQAAGKSMDFLLANNLFAQANVLLKRGEATAAIHVLAQGRELVARMMPTTVLASAYEYKTGYANFKLGFLEIALKHFENSIDLANRRGIECETARGLRMKAIVQKEMGSLLGSEEGEAGDAMKAAEEILRRFEIRENWDLSHYLDEEEKYDMLVCGQRR